MTYLALLDALCPAMYAAGDLIEDIRGRGVAVRKKEDRSPVTEADEQAERLLIAAIRAQDPQATIIGEESFCADQDEVNDGRFWLIDPLDGTRGFVKGRPDYSVNVALIESGQPVLGLLLAPRTGILWLGIVGQGAWREEKNKARQPIHTRALMSPPFIAVSQAHPDRITQAYVDSFPDADVRASSSSLKFCLLAEGKADIYPRVGPTCEWDTGAGDAILRAAGGMTQAPDGSPFTYGKPGYRNTPFLAVGDAQASVPPLAGFV